MHPAAKRVQNKCPCSNGQTSQTLSDRWWVPVIADLIAN